MGKSIFDKPVGESEHCWNNRHIGTTSSILCELCGTEHPELDPEDDSRIVDRFLGLQVVEDCCGRVFDVLYEEIGEEFTRQFLADFADNPSDPRFRILLRTLPDILEKARQKAKEISKTTAELQNTTSDINQLVSSQPAEISIAEEE